MFKPNNPESNMTYNPNLTEELQLEATKHRCRGVPAGCHSLWVLLLGL